jgi:hypothetical protein
LTKRTNLLNLEKTIYKFYLEKKMKKTVLFAAAFSLFFGTAFVGEVNTAELKSEYNSPSRIDVKGSWDVFLTASYLYWQAREDGLSPGDYYSTTNTYEPVYQLPFDFTSGFKVGIGTNLNHDNWIMHFEYTRLHVKNSAHYHAENQGADVYTIYPYWNDSYASRFDPIHDAQVEWKLQYDMMDLKVARPSYEGSCLTVLPFWGLRGGWIMQQYDVDYEFLPTVAYKTIARTNSWLAGPRLGVEADYLLGSGFRFFGDTSIALLYQRLKTAARVPNYTHGTALYNETENTAQVTPNFDLITGFGWGYYLDHKKYYVDLSAAYDFHYFFEQNRMKRILDLGSDYVAGKGKDLVLQGLTITARFDF